MDIGDSRRYEYACGDFIVTRIAEDEYDIVFVGCPGSDFGNTHAGHVITCPGDNLAALVSAMVWKVLRIRITNKVGVKISREYYEQKSKKY